MPLLFCPQEAGRLLYIGQNEWTHVNCAIWSAEVFEENDGSLKNVHAAVARGRQMVRAWARKDGHLLGSQVGTFSGVENPALHDDLWDVCFHSTAGPCHSSCGAGN